jgi:hypothetical protein
MKWLEWLAAKRKGIVDVLRAKEKVQTLWETLAAKETIIARRGRYQGPILRWRKTFHHNPSNAALECWQTAVIISIVDRVWSAVYRLWALGVKMRDAQAGA